MNYGRISIWMRPVFSFGEACTASLTFHIMTCLNSICIVAVHHRSHRYASFLRPAYGTIILHQYSRILIFVVLDRYQMVRDLIGSQHLRLPLMAGKYNNLSRIGVCQPAKGCAQPVIIIEDKAVIKNQGKMCIRDRYRRNRTSAENPVGVGAKAGTSGQLQNPGRSSPPYSGRK